ncbi:hypothetical protein [Pseudanabaena minima]|uniref:hypothetical protein n=1 Tax=Pseudanabaena minima TaxID=890415 RepID=UPI003DA8621C
MKTDTERLTKLESDNKKLIGMINTISAVLSQVSDKNDPLISKLLDGLDLAIGKFQA